MVTGSSSQGALLCRSPSLPSQSSKLNFIFPHVCLPEGEWTPPSICFGTCLGHHIPLWKTEIFRGSGQMLAAWHPSRRKGTMCSWWRGLFSDLIAADLNQCELAQKVKQCQHGAKGCERKLKVHACSLYLDHAASMDCCVGHDQDNTLHSAGGR